MCHLVPDTGTNLLAARKLMCHLVPDTGTHLLAARIARKLSLDTLWLLHLAPQAHLEEEKQRQQAEQAQQQQQQEVLQAQEECSQQQHEHEQQQSQPLQQQNDQAAAGIQSQRAFSSSGRSSNAMQHQQQQPELQLPSFKRLRSTVNARDLYRRTPLLVAAKHGHLECAQMLADAAANIFAVDREGNT